MSRPWAQNDFRSNEKSVVLPADDTLTIKHLGTDGAETVLKDGLKVLAGEVVDGTFISAAALDTFLAEQVARAKAEDVLFSVHLKATMMKVSDPIIFGHVVRAYFKDVYAAYGEQLLAAGLDGTNGLAAVLAGLDSLDNGAEIKAAFDKAMADGPSLAMVNSDKGITGLHVPSDIIVDASMPAMIRTSGHMWGPDGARGRHPRRHPRLLLCRHLSGRHRRLPGQWRIRPHHDGLGAECRAHGTEGRGIR
jgi:isocitrate dehydrogenase